MCRNTGAEIVHDESQDAPSPSAISIAITAPEDIKDAKNPSHIGDAGLRSLDHCG